MKSSLAFRWIDCSMNASSEKKRKKKKDFDSIMKREQQLSVLERQHLGSVLKMKIPIRALTCLSVPDKGTETQTARNKIKF